MLALSTSQLHFLQLLFARQVSEQKGSCRMKSWFEALALGTLLAIAIILLQILWYLKANV